MKNWVTNILTVQQYDMKLRDLETKYRTIPGERAKLREEYEAAKAQLAAARENAARVERAGKQTESEIAALNDKIRKSLTQSALVKKNAEYQALMTEIDNSKTGSPNSKPGRSNSWTSRKPPGRRSRNRKRCSPRHRRRSASSSPISSS